MKKGILLLILCFFIGILQLSAGVNISGFQENWFKIQQYNPALYEHDTSNITDHFKYDLYEVTNYSELKLWANPTNNTDIYAKLSNLKDMNEAHLKYRFDESGHGFESYFFVKERRFWIDDPLLGLVNEDIASDWSNAAGIRTDFWGISGINGAYIFNRPMWKDYTANIMLLKYGLTKNSRMGFYYYKKDWGPTFSDYNRVIAAYLKMNFKGMYSALEVARSATPSDPSLKNSRNFALGFLLDNLYFNLQSIGQLGFSFKYMNNMKYYSNQFGSTWGDNENNKRLFRLNSYYKFPEKSITYTLREEYKADDDGSNAGLTTYNELYVEFIHGFSFKSFYNYYYSFGQNLAYPSLFFQIEANQKNVWLRMQYKLSNINTQYLKYLYGIETSISLTKKLKGFFRIATVADYRSLNTHTFFGQLRYDIGNGFENYIEYGNSGHASNDLINDDGFADGSESTENIFKIGFKASW